MLVKCDAGQLEWRTLVELSRDEIALQEILNKEDTHTKNQHLFNLPSRLIAKIYLFRTIYRGSGYAFANDPQFMHVSKDAKFWDDIGEKFYHKYSGIDAKHHEWKDLVLNNTPIVIPSGREWIIEMGADRWGNVKIPWTVLTNYPNQGLGADVMMLVRIMLYRRIKESKRDIRFISTVHDDIKFDCRKADVQFVVDTCYQVFDDLIPAIYKAWGGYEWIVPMTCEVYQGMDMLNMEEVKRS